MFAVSSVISAVGLAVGVAGIGYSVYNNEKAAEANAAAATDQEGIANLQAANVGVQKQQLALQTQQQTLQTNTNIAVIQDQSQADTIRQQAATLDATRQKREAIRNGIVARAQSLTAATNQGASAPGSSAIKQSDASISGQTDTNLLGITQNQDVGNKLYAINQDITSQYLNAQTANLSYVQQSQVLQDQELDTQGQIYSLGGQASANYASAAISTGNAAIGTGMTQLGNAVVAGYPTINKLTSYFGSKFS